MDDSQEFPEKAQVKLVRGKLFEESKAHIIYNAVRTIDPVNERFFYDLYEADKLIYPRVNPLFLDFV